MDPNATLAILCDPDTDTDSFIEACDSLADWLARGGCMPDGSLAEHVADRAFGVGREDLVIRLTR